jgi:hypothetical protein
VVISSVDPLSFIDKQPKPTTSVILRRDSLDKQSAGKYSIISRKAYLCTRAAFLIALFIVASIVKGNAQATPATGVVNIGGPGLQFLFFQDQGLKYDSGTVWVTINGTDHEEVTYDEHDALRDWYTVATDLAAMINSSSSLVTATTTGVPDGAPGIVLTARTGGANTNYSLAVGSTYCTTCGYFDDLGFHPFFTQPSYVPTSAATMTGGADAPVKGYVNPKYVILAWTYAPPGSKSSVVNNNSTMIGSSTATNDSFANQVSESVTIAGTTGSVLGKLDGVEVSGTESTSYTNEQDTSKSISISQMKTFITTVPGPSNDAFGVNHDYDVVWLWLNPLADFSVFPNQPNSVLWTGYHFDMSDIPRMDIFGVEMGWLNGHFGTIPFDIQHVLDRTWAAGQTWPAGQGPGLTGPGPGSDFDKIVKANPFSDPAYVVTLAPAAITTADGRFTITGNQNIIYVPPGPGGNPTTQAYSANYVQTDVTGKGAKYTFSQGFATEEKFTGPLFLSMLTIDLKQSDTLTWIHQFSQNMTQSAGNTVSFSVTGPAAAANYSGPTEFLVFQDNIFGTFMFYPVNQASDFSIGASPSTQTAPAGGHATYTVSTTALRGFSGTTNLTVGGLPTGATATFAPTSLTGTGTSSLTITVPASVTAGNYSLVITGTSGTLSHTAQATLTVTAPDFSIAATLTTQTVTAGGSTTYTVSTIANNGFTGSVSLGTSGLPTGATASFSPASISGSTTSTLTISTLSSTPAATYTITITGISGSINHSTAVLLTVNAPTGNVTISAPANNSNQSTSVRVTASATETGTQIAQMQVWDNTTGLRLGINNGSTIDQTYTLAAGTHQIIVEDLAAGTFAIIHTSSVTITVFADGVHITAPVNNASITGPVHVTGFATEAATQIAQMQVWDNTTGVRLGINNGSTIDQTYTLAPGTHQIIMEDLATGTFALIHTATVTVTVH